MKLHIRQSPDDLIHELATYILSVAKKSIAARGQFNFVLSGGSSPRRLYELLASKEYKSQLDWDHTFFFFGDERFVPENDEERNSLMAKKALFDPLKIPDSQIFKVDTTSSPEKSAERYFNTISKHFGQKPVHFDLILLGLGDDAHTASLFPATSVLEDEEAGIRSVYLQDKEVYRITMTAPLINQAHQLAFLVFGKSKAEAVAHVLEGREGSEHEFPARLIRPHAAEIQWFMDTEASSLLRDK